MNRPAGDAPAVGAQRPRLLSVSIDEDDPCVGTVKVDIPGEGILTTTYQWDTPEEARHRLPMAAEQALAAPQAREPGETRSVRRFDTTAGTFYLGWLGGPPTWRWPKIGARKSTGHVEVMAGWRRRAAVVRWQYRSTGE